MHTTRANPLVCTLEGLFNPFYILKNWELIITKEHFLSTCHGHWHLPHLSSTRYILIEYINALMYAFIHSIDSADFEQGTVLNIRDKSSNMSLPYEVDSQVEERNNSLNK